MSLIKLYIKTTNHKYPIIIGNNILNKIQKLLKENLINFNQCLVVVDKKVPRNLINKLVKCLPKKKIVLHYFEATERNKNQKNVDKILAILFNSLTE